MQPGHWGGGETLKLAMGGLWAPRAGNLDGQAGSLKSKALFSGFCFRWKEKETSIYGALGRGAFPGPPHLILS